MPSLHSHLWQLHDEVMGICLLGSSHNFFMSHIFSSIADILFYWRRKENGLLAHNTNVISQPVDIDMFDIIAINKDLQWQWTEGWQMQIRQNKKTTDGQQAGRPVGSKRRKRRMLVQRWTNVYGWENHLRCGRKMGRWTWKNNRWTNRCMSR